LLDKGLTSWVCTPLMHSILLWFIHTRVCCHLWIMFILFAWKIHVFLTYWVSAKVCAAHMFAFLWKYTYVLLIVWKRRVIIITYRIGQNRYQNLLTQN
jgi:hypothetical protein